MWQDVREFVRFILTHPNTLHADKPPSRPLELFVKYAAAAVAAATMLLSYEFIIIQPHHDWMVTTLVGILTIAMVFVIGGSLGWGPGSFYATIVTVYLFGLLRLQHPGLLRNLIVTFEYAVFFTILNFMAASFRLSWSLYRARTRAHMAELEIANRKLEAESHAKDEFINTASHELRTPLTSLSLTSQLLRHHLPPNETAVLDAKKLRLIRGHIDLMGAQISRVVSALTDMTDAIHLEREMLVMNPEEVDMGELVQHVVEECRILFDGRTIDFRRPSEPLCVNGDSHRFAQAIYHYISNACKYSPPDEIVRVVCHRERREVHIAVYDQGYGVPLDKQEAIWTRYYHTTAPQQAHSSHVGLGLGLYICKTIIEAHGGRVGCRSSLGAGSTFWFALPAGTGADAALGQESPVVVLPRDNIVSFFAADAAADADAEAAADVADAAQQKDTAHAHS